MSLGLLIPSLALILTSTVAFLLLRQKRQKYPFPPGPHPKLFFGNALDIPSRKPWIKYMDWSKEFGSDIIHLTAFTKHIIILLKMKDVRELFEKKSATYSDRPSIPIIKLLGIERITPSLRYGNEWKKHRRLFQEGLSKHLMPTYAVIRTEKVHVLLGQLLRFPTEYRKHCKWFSAAIVMATTFGYDYHPAQEQDRFVELAEETAVGISTLFLPGSTLVNVLPFLRHIPSWMPFATTQKTAARIRKSLNAYRNEPFEYVERHLAAGTAKPSMLKAILERRVKTNGLYEDEGILKDMVTTTYLAGVEAFQSATLTILLAITLHPAAQRRAQEEIDRVIGTGRLPTADDRPSLPYVNAFLREALRWRPVFPQGVAHTPTSDDVYNGFYFPEGTMIIPNIWAITRDEDVYPDAESFLPERFINPDGSLIEDSVDYVYGFGRRLCPGQYVSDTVLWLMIACILSTFSITKARDENGVEIEIDPTAFKDTVVSAPLPFPCSITPRSGKAEALIRTAIEAHDASRIHPIVHNSS